MATTKTRFVFHADDDLAERIKGISAETGAPVAEVIRRALRLNPFMDMLTPDQRKAETDNRDRIVALLKREPELAVYFPGYSVTPNPASAARPNQPVLVATKAQE